MPFGIACCPFAAYAAQQVLDPESLDPIKRWGIMGVLAGPPELPKKPDVMKITKEICR